MVLGGDTGGEVPRGSRRSVPRGRVRSSGVAACRCGQAQVWGTQGRYICEGKAAPAGLSGEAVSGTVPRGPPASLPHSASAAVGRSRAPAASRDLSPLAPAVASCGTSDAQVSASASEGRDEATCRNGKVEQEALKKYDKGRKYRNI